jgi:pyruvate ferredoxin oxidoreductase delta subunit
MSDLKNWQELPYGGVILEAGSAAKYETGSWRTWKPITHREHCAHCLKCWEYCPEDAITLENGFDAAGAPRKLVKEVNYFHCKGCGLCVRECPVNKQGKVKALESVRDEV